MQPNDDIPNRMKRKLSTLFTLLYFLWSVTFVSAQSYETSRERGLELLRQGKCEEAITMFNRAKLESDYNANNNDIDVLIRRAGICEPMATLSGGVIFLTNVVNTRVDFGSGGETYPIGEPIKKTPGTYTVTITKDGYEPFITEINVSGDSTTSIPVTLIPEFALLSLNIEPADNIPFQKYPTVSIGTEIINSSDLFNRASRRSINESETVTLYHVYREGIALPPGKHSLTISDQAFRKESREFEAEKKMSPNSLTVTLQPLKGTLHIAGGHEAMGAKIYINDKATTYTIPTTKELRPGEYLLRFEKEGYMTPGEEKYRVQIKENTDTTLRITMGIFVRCRITSEPLGAEVYLNGNMIGILTEKNSVFERNLMEGKNDIIIRRSGFRDYTQEIIVSKATDKQLEIHAKLEHHHSIRIQSERAGLDIIVKRGREIISFGNKTPADILLPHGQYTLVLRDTTPGNRYYGNLVFDGAKNVVDVPCYSWGTFTTLVADYFFVGPKSTADINYYNLMTKFHFGRFNILPGLSTSILRASMFSVNDRYKGLDIEANVDDKNVNVDNAKYSNMMFSLSCLFINGEFRLGGYFFKHLGVSAIASYAWSPHLSFIPFSHISGHELFTGIEVTSRISILNFNIKIGKQMYWGNCNFLVNKDAKPISIAGGESYKDKFYSTPINLDGFAVSVGMTLGRSISYGNNTLRLW